MAATDIRNYTRRRMPRPPFVRIKEAILPGWDISLSFVGAARAKRLNTTLRGKVYVPNVLSYEVGTKSGEVIICMDRVLKEHKTYHIGSPIHFAEYLFIHGLLHLKGYPHGPTMDKMERALMARLAPDSLFNETTHRHRHRHRNTPDQGRGGGRGARKGKHRKP